MIKTQILSWAVQDLNLVGKWTRSCAWGGQQGREIVPAALTSNLALSFSPQQTLTQTVTHKVTLAGPGPLAGRFLLVLGFP